MTPSSSLSSPSSPADAAARRAAADAWSFGRHGEPEPSGLDSGRIGYFMVLTDEGCPICRAAHRWLAGRAQLVPLVFVSAGSDGARARFPGLDHAATLRDLTVVADNGDVWVDDGAWLACLWALADYRALAERMSSPQMLPAARKFIAAAAAVRQHTREAGYGDACDDRCR